MGDVGATHAAPTSANDAEKAPCEVTYTPPGCGSLLVAPHIVIPLAGVQAGKLLALTRAPLMPSESLLGVSNQVLTVAVSSPKISALFANIHVAFTLLFKLTSLCQSSSYCLVQLMAVILSEVNHRIIGWKRSLRS